jgi:formamidopyrimidine-DNA glycosylase
MFELPEITVLARQMNDSLPGKTIQRGQLGNSPHKFVWYNRTHEEFERLTEGKAVGQARPQGRFLMIPLEPGYTLLMGETGGKVQLHPAGAKLPKKYHLYLQFHDNDFLTATTQMWGAYELYEAGQEQDREYVKGMAPTPVDPAFTYDYFDALVDEVVAGKKRSVKSLLTQEQTIPGLGNAIAQDIMFNARLHPKHAVPDLSPEQRRALYDAILGTVQDVIDGGGRYDEYDLYGERGGYVRLMDKNATSRPCPGCGGEVIKISYLGGACYLCETCQVLSMTYPP